MFGGLRRKIDLLLALNRAAGALKEAAVMGKLKPAIVGLGGAAVTGAVGSVWAACPDLKAQFVVIAIAAVGGALTTWMLRPEKAAGLKAAASGIGALLLGGIVTRVTALCPDLIAQLPALVMSGLTVGLGLYLKSHREPPK